MIGRLRTFLRSVLDRKRVERELDEEMRFHLEKLIEENLAAGMDGETARLAALSSFGGLEQSKEECRDARGTAWLDGLVKDIGYALRFLRHSPGFTVVTVLSLALGVGANSAIYSLVHQVLIQRLPARDPEALVLLSWNGMSPGRWWGRTTDRDLLSRPLYQELAAENRDHLHVFSEMFARKPANVYLAVGGMPEPAPVELVSGSYFRALGVGAVLGRVLGDTDDERPGESPVVVLSFDYWKNRLGGASDVIGRKLLVNNQSVVVIGVAAEGFRGIDPVEPSVLWMPTMLQQQAAPEYGTMIDDRRAKWLHVLGRLAPGVSAAQARTAMQPWFKAMLAADTQREGWPKVGGRDRLRFLASTLEVLPAARGRSDQRAVLQRPLLILEAGATLVLLLACLNVANLLLARTFARRREIAVRVALGASARQVARESAVETALLAIGGAIVGVGLAPVVGRSLTSFLPPTVFLNTGVDGRMLITSLGMAAATAVVFGLAPAMHASRTRPSEALKEQSGTVAGGVPLRRALVVGQIALALVLLTGAGLFVRTLGSLRARASYVSASLLTFQMDLSKRGYPPQDAKRKVLELFTALRGLPGVDSVALSRIALMAGGSYKMRYTIGPGVPIVTDDVHGFMVSPRFFATLGLPLVTGRDFVEPRSGLAPSDDYRSAIVNQSFVRRYLRGRSPVGARLGVGVDSEKPPAIEIVGVVPDFPYSGLRVAEEQVFFPALDRELQGATFFVRTHGAAESAFASVRSTVQRLDPTVPIVGLRTLDAQLDAALVSERFLATLATAFATLAALLAVMGLYGVMSFVVSRRTREIGIRLALGSSPLGAAGLIVRDAALLVTIGLSIGLPTAWVCSRLVESQLFGVRSMDPETTAAAVVLVAVVGLIASALPALRATAVSAHAPRRR
jgi:predicted permease